MSHARKLDDDLHHAQPLWNQHFDALRVFYLTNPADYYVWTSWVGVDYADSVALHLQASTHGPFDNEPDSVQDALWSRRDFPEWEARRVIAF